jgi:hypothetical protein
MVQTIKVALAKVNEYVIQQKTGNGALTFTLPKQFRVDNQLRVGDRVCVFRDAVNPAQLIIRVEKHGTEKET